MTESEQLNSIWTSINEKLDRNWQLNMHIIQSSNLDKARRKMNSLIWIKAITMGVYGLITFLFIVYAISRWQVPHQALTGIVFSVWTLAIFITSIHELSVAVSIDYAEKIPILQKKLIEMKLIIIRYLRLSVWIFPLYFGFVILLFDLFLSVDVVSSGNSNWILSNVLLSIGLFIPMAIWMHRKLSPKNVGKKWMNKLLRGNGSQINDAINLLEEIKAYKK